MFANWTIVCQVGRNDSAHCTGPVTAEPHKRYGNAPAEMVMLTMVALKKGHVSTLDDCVIAYLWFPRLGLCRPNAPW